MHHPPLTEWGFSSLWLLLVPATGIAPDLGHPTSESPMWKQWSKLVSEHTIVRACINTVWHVAGWVQNCTGLQSSFSYLWEVLCTGGPSLTKVSDGGYMGMNYPGILQVWRPAIPLRWRPSRTDCHVICHVTHDLRTCLWILKIEVKSLC